MANLASSLTTYAKAYMYMPFCCMTLKVTKQLKTGLNAAAHLSLKGCALPCQAFELLAYEVSQMHIITSRRC